MKSSIFKLTISFVLFFFLSGVIHAEEPAMMIGQGRASGEVSYEFNLLCDPDLGTTLRLEWSAGKFELQKVTNTVFCAEASRSKSCASASVVSSRKAIQKK